MILATEIFYIKKKAVLIQAITRNYDVVNPPLATDATLPAPTVLAKDATLPAPIIIEKDATLTTIDKHEFTVNYNCPLITNRTATSTVEIYDSNLGKSLMIASQARICRDCGLNCPASALPGALRKGPFGIPQFVDSFSRKKNG